MEYSKDTYQSFSDLTKLGIMEPLIADAQRPNFTFFKEIKSFQRTKGGFIVQFEIVQSPFHYDYASLVDDPKDKFKILNFMVKVYTDNKDAIRQMEFMKETENVFKLHSEYKNYFLHEPSVCPRIFHISDLQTGLSKLEFDFLSTLVRLSKMTGTIEVKPNMMFFISEYKGIDLQTVLDKSLKKAKTSYDLLISNKTPITPVIEDILAKFEKEYLCYARRLMFRCAELSYVHLDLHLRNVLVDEDASTGSKFFSVIDLEDLFKLDVTDYDTISRYLLREKHAMSLFKILAGKNIKLTLPDGSLSLLNTWKYFIDMNFPTTFSSYGLSFFFTNNSFVDGFESAFTNDSEVKLLKTEFVNNRSKENYKKLKDNINSRVKAYLDGTLDFPDAFKKQVDASILMHKKHSLNYAWLCWSFDGALINFVHEGVGRPNPSNVASESVFLEFVRDNLKKRLTNWKNSPKRSNPWRKYYSDRTKSYFNFNSDTGESHMYPWTIHKSRRYKHKSGSPYEYEFNENTGEKRWLVSLKKSVKKLCARRKRTKKK